MSAERQTDKVVQTWAKTHRVVPSEYYEPSKLTEIQDVVRRAASTGKTLRVVGSGHSPNDCVMTTDIIMSLKRFNQMLTIDLENKLVKVQAGITLEELNDSLANVGLALPNLGSVSEQSIAGAIATGTHGTGISLGAISESIAELQLVLADGSVAICSKAVRQDLFQAALCSFGCMGVVTGVIIQAVAAFDLDATETSDTLGNVLSNLTSRVRSVPYYRFWWFPHTDRVMEWKAVPVPPNWAKRTTTVHPYTLRWVMYPVIRVHNWFWTTLIGFHFYQLLLYIGIYVPRIIPWINFLWHLLYFSSDKRVIERSDKVFNFDCLFQQHVDEWSIPIDALPQALAAIKALLDDKGHNVHFPIEVRFVAGDDTWLSPAYGRTSAFIGIIMYKPFGHEVDFKAYFRQFEEIMVRYDGRPHWAKDFHIKGDSDFRRTYPKWDAFKTLRAQLDPGDTFVNAFVRRTLGLEPKLAVADSSLILRQGTADVPSCQRATTAMALHTQ